MERSSLRQKIGTIIYDLPRFLWAMRPSRDAPWILMRNRNERLIPERNNRGVACDWQWTSDLHIARVYPRLGGWLMNRALHYWPIESRDDPGKQEATSSPELSFIIGHRGKERLPHLLATLRTIAAQRDVSLECVVVEQSPTPEVKEELRSWVRYIHTPLPFADMPYSRAWAFNVGARVARSQVLVLHDNDMLVPKDYAKEIVARVREGYEVINLKRFIFFLNPAYSARVLRENELPVDAAPQSIMQNAEGGGSLGITRDAYLGIGGFDESFVGWGGEDNEFWERAKTRRFWPYGYLPIVHLWHAPQPGKNDAKRQTAELLEKLSAIPIEQRISNLVANNFAAAPPIHHSTNYSIDDGVELKNVRH